MRLHHRLTFSALITIALLLFVSSYSYSEIKVGWVRAGSWNKMSEVQKLLYLAGFFDAWAIASDTEKGDVTTSVSLEVYVRGLDKFYGDYRNDLIPAMFALQIVSKEIQGQELEVIENTKRKLRKYSHKIAREQLLPE